MTTPEIPCAQPAQAVGIDPMQDPMRPTYASLEYRDDTPAELVLRKLACWLGAGGFNAPTVDAEQFHRKIVWGVEQAVKQAKAGTSSGDDWCRAHGQPTYNDLAMELGHVEKELQEIRSTVMGEDWGGNLGARLIGEVLDHIREMRTKAAA